MRLGHLLAAHCCLFALSLAPAHAQTIVLDPGHGGTNKGAYSKRTRRYEKRIALAIARSTALRLRRLLPAAKVLLTRKRDRYLTLAQRVEIANRARAAIFLSVHLNASASRSRSGYETFVLSRDASDREAARLARAENGRGAASAKGGATASTLSAILGDLKQRASHVRSVKLARAIQKALGRARPRARNGGVKQAPFDVLMGLRMPGALVEVGYIDHPREGPELARRRVHERIAAGLAAGIVGFLSTKRLALRRGRRPR